MEVILKERFLLKSLKYVVYKEEKYFVAQCLNVDISSFGESIDEAVDNLTEAVELYFEDNDAAQFHKIEMAMIGEKDVDVA